MGRLTAAVSAPPGATLVSLLVLVSSFEAIFASLFVLRVLVARQAAGRQRAIDLERFRQLRRTDHVGTQNAQRTQS